MALHGRSRSTPTARLPDLAAQIEAEHQAAHRAARTAVEHAIECGRLLLEAKTAVGHGGWLKWVKANISFGARQVQKYVRLAQRAGELPNTTSNSHLTVDRALALLARPMTEHSLSVMSSSLSPEWYTPPHIVERVIATLGEIDLDPSWHPQSPVRARVTYTVDDDGLAHRWTGRVYINPPYGREIDNWIAKLISEHTAGAVIEAIALVPARVDTEWFRRLDPFPRCFVFGRLKFANADNPAPFPSAVFYLGPRVDRFVSGVRPRRGDLRAHRREHGSRPINSMTRDLALTALAYARRGFRVHPCAPG